MYIQKLGKGCWLFGTIFKHKGKWFARFAKNVHRPFINITKYDKKIEGFEAKIYQTKDEVRYELNKFLATIERQQDDN